MTTARPPLIDGAAALERLAAGAGGVTAVLAANTIFLHPDTVAQVGGQPLFRVIRDQRRRGEIATVDDGEHGPTDVMCCDNHSPTVAFLWAAGRSRGVDVQFNHVWSESTNWRRYTALWNLCATPAFLAKLTDGAGRGGSVAALKYRAWDLYGQPVGEPPSKPAGYNDLRWLDPLDPVADLEAQLRERLAASPKSRAAISARTLGWLFSDWQPDQSLSGPESMQLGDVVDAYEGDELIEVLARFPYGPSDKVAVGYDDPSWWQQVEDREILPNSIEHLAALRHGGRLDAETYGRVLERLRHGGQDPASFV